MNKAIYRMRRRLLAAGECSRGAAMIEFALIAPALILVILGIIEMAMVMVVTTLMEGGLRQASRFGITGFIPDGETREEIVLQIVTDNTIGLIDVSDASLTSFVYPSFGDIGKPEPLEDDNENGVHDEGEFYVDVNGNSQWDPDMGTAGLGGPGEVVLYTLSAEWEFMTPFIGNLVSDNGKIPLTASMVIRNEPYEIEEEEEET